MDDELDASEAAVQERQARVGQRISAAIDEIDAAVMSAKSYTDFIPLVESALEQLNYRLGETAFYEPLSPVARENALDLTQTDRRQLLRMARQYFLKDPLCRQAIRLTTNYLLGEGGLRYASTLTDVTAEIDRFWADDDNQVELTSFASQQRKSNEKQVDGEIFLVLFWDKDMQLKVRTLPPEEITQIVTSEDDHRRPLYYERSYTPQTYNMKTGRWSSRARPRRVYYADWKNYAPGEWGMEKGAPIADGVICHLAANRIGWQQRGYTDMYSYLDWAKANRQLLRDWVTIVKSYSTLAWQAKINGDTPGQIDAVRERLRSLLPDMSGQVGGGVPPGGTGGVFVGDGRVDMSPIKTAGMATNPADSREVRLMIASGSGMPEHFFGNAGNANLATATAMDLPTLKQFLAGQRCWEDDYKAILLYQLAGAVRAKRVESLEVVEDVDDRGRVVSRRLVRTDGKGDIVTVKAPPILKSDLMAVAQALQTLELAGLVPLEDLARHAMTALDLPNIDGRLAEHDVLAVRRAVAEAAAPPPPVSAPPGGTDQPPQ